jgi:hypothetical protein
MNESKSFAFNPHWIGNTCCRDYKIGNIVIKDVPDETVLRLTKFKGSYGFAIGNVIEFLEDCEIEVVLADPHLRAKDD